MEKYFLSYNRDELSHLKNEQNNLIVDMLSQQIANSKENIYFDNLDFISLDKEIFNNIEKWMQDKNTIVLIVSDYNIFYGWTEKEIISAINYEKPIFQISIKKFIRFYINKKMSFQDIIRKKARKLKY